MTKGARNSSIDRSQPIPLVRGHTQGSYRAPSEPEHREALSSPAPTLAPDWMEEMLANDEELRYVREEAMRPRYPRGFIP